MDNKTHFILGTKFYMLWQQGAIFRGFIKKKDHKANIYLGASRTCPLYVFDSDMEAKVNMRRCVTDGLERETVVIILRVINPVNPSLCLNVHESWRIYTKSKSSQRSIGRPQKLICHV
jgi:hypothetical protein